MSYHPYQPMTRSYQPPLYRHAGQEERFFPLLPFVAGLAIGPLLFNSFGGNTYYPAPNYGPNFGPNYGPQFGPGYGPGFGPQFGPQFGPHFRPQ
ncbi:penicillin-binding protein [Alkalihalobacillus sp. 1P02AB]|uniref:penicillin-binding protein n=1 Tax=Alkalihalobacillus sp. 1P02AB TaxID=3132260 RepID=UPI0039A73F64